MTEILTTKYKTDLLRLFYNDLASNEFYVFVSSLTTDPTSRVSAANTKVSEIQFLDNVLQCIDYVYYKNKDFEIIIS
mgnify:CR=1 FL=1